MAYSVATKTATIGELLRTRASLAVPDYQRDYSWTAEEVEQLWEDLDFLRKESREEHFMGAIVLTEEHSDKHFIVDGQQRLATVFILISALRLRARELEDNELADMLQGRFGEKVLKTRKIKSKLRLNENDDRFFQKWIVDENAVADIRKAVRDKRLLKSHRLMLDAFLRLYDKISALAPSRTEINKLSEFIDEAVDKFLTVIRIEVSGEEEAYWLFETLNDRGLELSIVDLLRNYLLRRAESGRNDAKQRWDAISNKVGRDAVAVFIRHWWMSKHGVVREKDLFREIKKKYDDGETIISFLDELEREADAYAALTDTNHPFWSSVEEPYRGKVLEAIEELVVFGITQCFPSLLSILVVEQSAERRARQMRTVATVAVRYSITSSGRGSGNVEKAYSQTAIALRQGTLKAQKEMLDHLRAVNPTDEELKLACEQFTTKKKGLARYLLTRIAAEKQPEVGEIWRGRKHTLEHILPKNPTEDWVKNFEDADEYVDRLANMLVLETHLNKAAARAKFLDKKQAYSKSAIKLNHELCTLTEWNSDELERRAGALATRMVQIWGNSSQQ